MTSPAGSSKGVNAGALVRLNTGASASVPTGKLGLDQETLTLEEALSRLEIENRLKEGAENLLQVLDTRVKERPREARDARRLQVMEELDQTNNAIQALKTRIHELSALSPLSDKIYKRQRSDDAVSTRPKLATIRSYSASAFPGQEKSSSPLHSVNTIVEELLDATSPSSHIISRCNALISLLKRDKELAKDIPVVVPKVCVPRFCSVGNPFLAAAGYRLARYILALSSAPNHTFLNSALERCLLTSLAKEDHHTLEREQALTLVRTLLLTGEALPLRFSGLVRAVISISEAEDRLSSLATETLTELLIWAPGIMQQTGGISSLLRSLVDGPLALCDEIIMAFMLHLDRPDHRRFIKESDLEVVYSCFTEHCKEALFSEDALLSATAVLLRMFNTWPGLVATSAHNFRGLASVLEALRVPSNSIRDVILEFLFSVLSIPVNNLTTTFLAGRRLTTMGRIPISAKGSSGDASSTTGKVNRGANLLNQFSALKLHLFLQLGVLDSLMVVVEDLNDVQSSRKATLLIGEILQLANVLLPLSVSRDLQSLSRLFSTATSFSNDGRLLATSALYQIESINRTRNKTSVAKIVNSADASSTKRGQRQVEQVKIKMGLQIDDTHFRNLLLDTQVLNTKNYTKWHWDTLTELVQGPLLNPKRLEESIRATKFMKRLLAFYRPFTHRFSAIKNTKPNQKYVRFGCLLLATLLANPEGFKYLMESKLLRQLSECLAQLDPMNQVPAAEALFSEARLKETLCHGYFEMIGTLTAHPQGIAMLERWRIFTSLYHLTELRSRSDLLISLLPHMDYSYEGHPRIILSKALMSGAKEVRLEASLLLGKLTEEFDDKTSKVADWALRLLTTQLYDPSTQVCEVAVRVLETACNSKHHLEHVVQLRPALEHLGQIGAPLLLRFLATSVGFHYLQELSYVGREMDDWHHGGNDEYVTLIESVLLLTEAPDLVSVKPSFDGRIPAHFYGELAKTAEGCDLLVTKGHFHHYVDRLRRQDADSSAEEVHHMKAALWAIGNIGATERGAPFLDNSQVVHFIVRIAEQSPFLGLRGTAYLVLGLISNTTVGVRLLEKSGWQGTVTRMGNPTGVCVPQTARSVLELSSWSSVNVKSVENDGGDIGLDSLEGTQRDIANALCNLSNHILANDAARQLVRLRQRHADAFFTKKMLDLTFDLLSRYQHRQGVRRFMIHLFQPENLADLASADESSTEKSVQLGRASSTEASGSLHSQSLRTLERRRSGLLDASSNAGDVLAQRRKLFNAPLVRSRRSQTIE
ncbi:Rapamycin-insensitive companion of mTOR, middle domain-domain-containing protein [Protomyces lactucae-debilis]|uniref:Rapamycin-insensitive companion of mTOR, middle domain-domain-containing protein n=1 Tax=Protomyces lactucae-debilis TaxID=2754530 RepID=A0A1Y2FFK6_PROLT|nr:Rapamycin-insensitive companion of mTOR, middle domain-containing protein [Protomyces lactucae-debilis]ORY81605.1 Rapamycin-insensitive companion of mTOR, middle domain-domain-containing protein [Protomyces lactucae-debilis]